MQTRVQGVLRRKPRAGVDTGSRASWSNEQVGSTNQQAATTSPFLWERAKYISMLSKQHSCLGFPVPCC